MSIWVYEFMSVEMFDIWGIQIIIMTLICDNNCGNEKKRILLRWWIDEMMYIFTTKMSMYRYYWDVNGIGLWLWIWDNWDTQNIVILMALVWYRKYYYDVMWSWLWR